MGFCTVLPTICPAAKNKTVTMRPEGKNNWRQISAAKSFNKQGATHFGFTKSGWKIFWQSSITAQI